MRESEFLWQTGEKGDSCTTYVHVFEESGGGIAINLEARFDKHQSLETLTFGPLPCQFSTTQIVRERRHISNEGESNTGLYNRSRLSLAIP